MNQTFLSSSKIPLIVVTLSAALAACEPRAPLLESRGPVSPAPAASVAAAAPSASVADVAARVMPSVVSVFSEKTIEMKRPQMFFDDPFTPFGRSPFDFFFDAPRRPRLEPGAPLRRSEQGVGSGVIVSSNGIIVTNHHVVGRADKIKVKLADDRELPARLIGSDEKSDIAVLRIDASDLPAIPVADSSRVRVGDSVLAIGNPFGIGQTVTMGIVSAVGRANVGITDYEDFLQTDAAINPGNSGGALVSMDGALIGINTAIVSRNGGFQGIGFAIPSNMAMQVKEAILKDGKVVRGWLGVAIQDITADLAESLALPSHAGALVSDVTADGPASKAGIIRGDVIAAFNGTRLKDSAQLRNLVALAGKGARANLVVVREKKELQIEVELGELPSSSSGDELWKDASGLLEGVTVSALDEERWPRGAPHRLKGVVVTRVDPQSIAAQAGLRSGDVILELNRTPVPNVQSFESASRAISSRALLLVWRDGFTTFIVLSQ